MCHAELKKGRLVGPVVTLPIGLQNWNHRFAVNLSYKAYFILYVTELAFFAQLSAFQCSRLEA